MGEGSKRIKNMSEDELDLLAIRLFKRYWKAFKILCRVILLILGIIITVQGYYYDNKKRRIVKEGRILTEKVEKGGNQVIFILEKEELLTDSMDSLMEISELNALLSNKGYKVISYR